MVPGQCQSIKIFMMVRFVYVEIFFNYIFISFHDTRFYDINGTWVVNGVYAITFNPNGKFKISFKDKSAKNILSERI